jgi:hypothetical protein
MTLSLCWICKGVREIVYTDSVERQYCRNCVALLPASQSDMLMSFLSATVPYRVGDIVSCKTAGQVYDGIGHVVEVSFDPKDLASPVVPMFRVAMDEKAYSQVPDEIWFSEICLERKLAAETDA